MNKDETKYWNNFYSNFTLLEPSSFCLFITTYIKNMNINNILDAGCGNGRDSYYLAQKYNVTGMDISTKPNDMDNCKFVLDSFVTCDKSSYDLIYSRFTFHSITNEMHDDFLNSICKDTLLCIETRSDKNENDTKFHGSTHYRNYTNIDYLKNLLNKYNFDIKYIEENKDFAIYKNENPYCIRVVCKKL